MRASVALFAVRHLLGLLLFAGGLLKLGAGWTFAEAIANYRLLPAAANQLLAVALPWIEIVGGLLLIFDLWVRPSALLAAILFGAFGVAAGSALARGLDIECGCFGTGGAARIGLGTLAVDLLGLAAAAALLWKGSPTELPAPRV